MPAVPPRRRHRRHVGRVRRQDREARQHALPRHAADRGQRARPRLPRRRARGARCWSSRSRPASARSSAASTSATTCASSACRATARAARSAWRVVLGRSPGARQDHHATASSSSSSRPIRRSYLPEVDRRRPRATTEVVQIDLNRPMAEIRAELAQYPVKTRLMLTGPMVVARDIAHAKLKERLDAGDGMPQYLQGPLRVLRRPGEDARGLRVGFVRPDDRRPHGQLRRRVPGRTAAAS